MNTDTSVTAEAETTAHRKAPARPRRKARKTASKAPGRKVKGNVGSKRGTANKEAGDRLGRPQTLGRFLAERVIRGMSNEAISKAAAKAYPKAASTTPKHVAWTRWNLKRRGVKNVPESK
jgi:hypothetical protein